MTIVKDLVKKLVGASIAFYLLFLAGLSYLYGSVFDSGNRAQNINVLFVDRDQGAIGEAVNSAYQSLQGPTFFTLVSKNASDYPTQDDMVKAVTHGDYWAAVAVNEKATERYLSALAGNSSTYDPTNAMVYVWNGVRYPSFSDTIFPINFQMLADRASSAFSEANGEKSLQTISEQSNTTKTSLYALFNPISTSQINIQAMDQGVRAYYHTLTIAMIVLEQFFFALALHFMFAALNLHNRVSMGTYAAIKVVASVVFCLGAAFCMTGNMWAFREGWGVNGNQYILSVLIMWLLMAVHNLTFQSLLMFLPVPAMPFCVILWVLINVTATASPLILSPGFYRVSYAVPSFNGYEVLTDIWSKGSVPSLYRALPILFSWLIVLLCVLVAGIVRLYRNSKQEKLTRVEASSQNSEALLESDQKA